MLFIAYGGGLAFGRTGTCLFSSVQWNAESVTSWMGGHTTMARLTFGRGKNLSYVTLVTHWKVFGSCAICVSLQFPPWISPEAVLSMNINQKIQFSRNWPTGPIRSRSQNVCGFIYMLPPNAIYFFIYFFFLRPWTGTERHLSMDWCEAPVALTWSPKNGEVFQNGRVTIFFN